MSLQKERRARVDVENRPLHSKLYGTISGGATNGYGAVFELAKPTRGSVPWKETLLYSFTDGDDGISPEGAPGCCLEPTAVSSKTLPLLVARLRGRARN